MTRIRSFLSSLTPWRALGIAVVGGGLAATWIRFVYGLGAATNLSDSVPWGLWVGFDVLVGVGLAAGGFTITATVHLFNLERFRPIVRPTLLTAFLGYLLVIVGLLFDLGRPYRVWHPLIMWNPHSVMFEVAWCVTLYTTVLALEFSPVVLERFGLKAPLRIIHAMTVPIVILGVILSTLHQSSLGTLYVIMPNKLHALWYSPLMPLFFFLSAIAAGLSMVTVESFLSSRAFGRRIELHLLRDLAPVVVVILALYAVTRGQDLVSSGAWRTLANPGPERYLFVVETLFGVVVPAVLLAIPAVRADRAGLFCASLLVVVGFIMNRLNIATAGMQRGFGAAYFPSVPELAVTAMLVVLGFVLFRLAVKYLSIFPAETPEEAQAPEVPAGWGGRIARSCLVLFAAALVGGAVGIDFGTVSALNAPGPAVASAGTGSGIAASGPWAAGLPSDLTFDTEGSPGPVTFSHASHVDQPTCGTCHTAGRFSILRQAEGRKALGEAAHDASRCGACHNGQSAFAAEDCESCHTPR